MLYLFVSAMASVSDPRARICFASCARISKPEGQPWWKLIADREPDVFAWLGDAVYADTLTWSSLGRQNKSAAVLPDFQASYQAQKEHPDYQLFASKTRIVGTWDDHDYGQDDSDKRFPHKDAAQRAFLDFLDVPQDSPRRKRKGVYSSERIPYGDSHVLLLLLDVRYHKDPWTSTDGDILGEEQWEWLSQEVMNSDAAIILIGSGIQVLWSDFGIVAEHWNRFPDACRRLVSLLSGRRTIFLSGDVHMFEVRHVTPWNALEITSSGLSHAWGDDAMSRMTALTGIPFLSDLARLSMTLAQLFMEHRYLVVNALQKNFACVDIIPEGAHVQAWSTSGEPLFQRLFSNEEFELVYDATYPINSGVGSSVWWLFALLVTVLFMIPVSACACLVWMWRRKRNRCSKAEKDD